MDAWMLPGPDDRMELLDDLQAILDSAAAGAVDAGSQAQRVLVALIESLEEPLPRAGA